MREKLRGGRGYLYWSFSIRVQCLRDSFGGFDRCATSWYTAVCQCASFEARLWLEVELFGSWKLDDLHHSRLKLGAWRGDAR